MFKKIVNKKYRRYLTLPNLLTAARPALWPILVYLSIVRNIKAFGVALLFYALTDSLDGYFARKYKIETKFGAKFDSFADNLGSFIIAPCLYLLFPEIIRDNILIIGVIILLFLFSTILLVFKLKNIGIHLWSSKLSQATFLFMVVATCIFGFSQLAFNLWVIIAIISTLELSIAIIISEPDENTRSILKLKKHKGKS